MLLILSARTVSEDIALPFGRLPPSFLPMGHQRLFALQTELARGEPCVMTVPDDFDIAPADLAVLEAAGVTLLPQPQSLRLPEAIGNALTRITTDGPLRILYGDTLVRMPEAALSQPDMVAVQQTTANYPWAFTRQTEDGIRFSDDPPQRLDSRRVVCGYYVFADTDLLAKACHEPTIVKALQFYHKHRPLSCIDADEWLDFGHLPLYFQSKKDMLVKRVFNELKFDNNWLLKSSDDVQKMRAEAHWFENLPQPLRLHVPRYGGRIERDFRAGYGLEYLNTPLLSDLSVFGALPLASWLEIIRGSFEFLKACWALSPPEGAPETSAAFAEQFFDTLVIRKTRERFAAFCEHSGMDPKTRLTINGETFDPLCDVVENLIAAIPPSRPEDIRFWHGDLFFGNMFYDFTAQRILCIDPRGHLASGETCLWGDFRYDLAKLAHSIIGQYDKILLGRATLDETAPDTWEFGVEAHTHQAEIEDIFARFVTESCDMDMRSLLALTALLFLSMLPLHKEDPHRQRQLLAMGLILSRKVEGDT